MLYYSGYTRALGGEWDTHLFLPRHYLLLRFTCYVYFRSHFQMWTMEIQLQISWLKKGSEASPYNQLLSHLIGKVIE